MRQSLPFFVARVTTRKVAPAVEESPSGEKEDGLLLPERVASVDKQQSKTIAVVHYHGKSLDESESKKGSKKRIDSSASLQSLRQSFGHISERVLAVVTTNLNAVTPVGLVDEQLAMFEEMDRPSTTAPPPNMILDQIHSSFIAPPTSVPTIESNIVDEESPPSSQNPFPSASTSDELLQSADNNENKNE